LNLDTANTRVGIGTNAPGSTLDVNGAAVATSFDARTATSLTIGGTNATSVTIGKSGVATSIGNITATGVALLSNTGVISSGPVDLSSNTYVSNILPVANGGSPFNEGAGAIFERNTTQDLLLGSTATASAKFGFLNVAGGTPTASISGTGNNALSLTGNGTIGTTNGQSLTIGTPSTGNITISQSGATTTINGTTVLSSLTPT